VIIKSFEEMDDIQKKQYCILEKKESKSEVVSLFDASADDRKDRNEINYNKTKKVIPIFGKEIVVSKRIAKLCTHPKLQSVIECNPNVMKNIDSHIRDSLLVQRIRN
jgi:hypothetical protein